MTDGAMPTGGAGDPPRVRSWITPKAVKGGTSGIEGMGVHAIEAIASGPILLRGMYLRGFADLTCPVPRPMSTAPMSTAAGRLY
jgi:hypothetical protein